MGSRRNMMVSVVGVGVVRVAFVLWRPCFQKCV